MLGFGALGEFALGEGPNQAPEVFTSSGEVPSSRITARYRDALAAPFLAFDPQPFVINISWFSGLSEPVRKKPRLLETLQQFMQFFPNPVVSFSWFDWLSDPVRIRPRLRDGLQEFLARISFIPIGYTARLDATEARDRFLGILSQFNIPISAYVDIIENDPRIRGFMGIIGNAAEPSILASISEPTSVPATGAPVSTVAGARVAIITGP